MSPPMPPMVTAQAGMREQMAEGIPGGPKGSAAALVRRFVCCCEITPLSGCSPGHLPSGAKLDFMERTTLDRKEICPRCGRPVAEPDSEGQYHTTIEESGQKWHMLRWNLNARETGIIGS